MEWGCPIVNLCNWVTVIPGVDGWVAGWLAGRDEDLEAERPEGFPSCDALRRPVASEWLAERPEGFSNVWRPVAACGIGIGLSPQTPSN